MAGGGAEISTLISHLSRFYTGIGIHGADSYTYCLLLISSYVYKMCRDASSSKLDEIWKNLVDFVSTLVARAYDVQNFYFK